MPPFLTTPWLSYFEKALGYDRYSYSNNNPVRYTDPTGHWIESALDVAFITYDIYDISANGLNWENGLSLAADVVGLALPVVTGGGMAVRALTHADDAAKIINATDNVIDAANAIDNAIDAGNAADNLTDIAKTMDDIPCSFSAETDVTTLEGTEDIAAIEIGDSVLAWNEADGTLGYYAVTDVLIHADQVLTELLIDGEWVETTPEHPFYVEGKGWTPAEDLKWGDEIRQSDGATGTIWLVWTVYRTQTMYNLTVGTAHTYFVGEGQWLVHNTCDPFSQLPERSGRNDPTTGILVANGQEVTLKSGVNGPALYAPGGKGSGFDAYTRTHVEGHASAWMQQNNVTQATLYINNPPCPNCTRNLPNMLPRNSIPDIFGPNGYFRRFFSTIME